jgi:ribonuclease HII
LSTAQKQRAFNWVIENIPAQNYAIFYGNARAIDEDKIGNVIMTCIHTGLQKIYETRKPKFNQILMDGNYFEPPFIPKGCAKEIECLKIPKGDSKYLCIAAASILAKVAHDRWIEEYANTNPHVDMTYLLKESKGYPGAKTSPQTLAIAEWGVHEHHRKVWITCQPFVKNRFDELAALDRYEKTKANVDPRIIKKLRKQIMEKDVDDIPDKIVEWDEFTEEERQNIRNMEEVHKKNLAKKTSVQHGKQESDSFDDEEEIKQKPKKQKSVFFIIEDSF